MVSLLSSMVVIINLNTSLNQHSFPKVCLLLVRQGFTWQQILLCVRGLCDKLLCWIPIIVTCIIMILDTL